MSRRVVWVFALLLVCPATLALINVRFSPKHLVDASEIIVAGAVEQDKDTNLWKLSVSEPIKGGKKLSGPQVFDLTKCNPDHVKAIAELFSGKGTSPVILFIGPKEEGRAALVHVSGAWLSAKDAGKDRWEISGYRNEMTGTFAGGTDMLVRMSKYLVNVPSADVPVSAGVRWADHCAVAKVDPKAALAAIEYPYGKTALFAGSAAGDRLFVAKADGSSFEDASATAKIGSSSVKFTFADINGDGLADLISFDGKSINVFTSGTEFRAAGAGWSFPVKDCVDLMPCSTDGKPGTLISTPSDPILLGSDEKGWKRIPVPAYAEDVGRRSACIVADLDNDGFVDILQPGENAGVLWRGKAGGFEQPVRSPVCTGPGSAKAAVADFNEDGFLDIFLAGPEKNSLWENDGKGGFIEVLRYGGSLSYKCPPHISDVKALDLNHDGRMDLCLAYSAGDLLYHFNRGFRSFGEEGEVRLPGVNAGPGNERTGQMALAVGDFNGDNSSDLAVLLADGTLHAYLNDRIDMPALLLRLPKGMTGPVTAACWLDEKNPAATGVAAIVGHSPGSLLPARYKGDVVIKYRFPGREAVAKKVSVGDRTTEITLTPDGK